MPSLPFRPLTIVLLVTPGRLLLSEISAGPPLFFHRSTGRRKMSSSASKKRNQDEFDMAPPGPQDAADGNKSQNAGDPSK